MILSDFEPHSTICVRWLACNRLVFLVRTDGGLPVSTPLEELPYPLIAVISYSEVLGSKPALIIMTNVLLRHSFRNTSELLLFGLKIHVIG